MHSPPVQRTVVGDVGQLIELKIGARIGATMTHASPMRGRAAPAHLGAGAARWGMLAAPAWEVGWSLVDLPLGRGRGISPGRGVPSPGWRPPRRVVTRVAPRKRQ